MNVRYFSDGDAQMLVSGRASRTNLVSVHSADVGEEGCCPLVGGVTGTDRHRLVALLTAQTDLLPAQQQTTFKSVFVTWSVIPKLLQ